MLLRGEVRDPEASGAIVSAVTITNDLSLARVYLRLLDAEPTEARRTALVKALDRAKGHVRRALASRLDFRTVPELRFAWDDTADRAARLDELNISRPETTAQDILAILRGMIDAASEAHEADRGALADRTRRAVFGYLHAAAQTASAVVFTTVRSAKLDCIWRIPGSRDGN